MYCKQRCESYRTSGAIQLSPDQDRIQSNPPCNSQCDQSSPQTASSYTPNPFFALPSYNEVTNNNDIYPLCETQVETTVYLLEGFDGTTGTIQAETTQQSPPSYDEAIVQNLQNGQARTEGVTGNNQSGLALQIHASSANQSNDTTHPVSLPPEYHWWKYFYAVTTSNLSQAFNNLYLHVK